MIGNNPEFDRNLWLELTPHRLIALPVVFGLLLMLNLVLNDYQLLRPTAFAAIGLFLLFTGVWGAKCASGSIYEEVMGRTWDWQRLSGLDPWPMTWGKLFGATAFAWYGGLFCLAVAALGLHNAGASSEEWRLFAVFLLIALLCHALALLLNLLFVRSRPLARAQGSGSLYLLVILLVLLVGTPLASAYTDQIQWYGWSLPTLDFALGSLFIVWLWTLLGAYRVMRREFLYTARPWVWVGFLFFLALYVGGLTGRSPVFWGLSAFLLWWAATLLALFVEPKDPVILRGLLADLRQGDWDRASLRIPSWLVALLLAVAAAILVLVAFAGEQLDLRGERYVAVVLIIPSLLCFMLRDVALFLLLGFTAGSKRPEVSAAVYLILLYFLVPSLLGRIGLEGLSALFIPRPDLNPLLALGGPLLGLAIVVALLIRRWGQLSRP